MQLNTLNRVISLFLIGGFVVVMAVVASEAHIEPLLKRYATMSAPAATFMAVALLSLTALAGTIVDAFGNLTVRSWIQKTLAKNREVARLFWCVSEYDEYACWREVLRGALVNNRNHARLSGDDMIKAASAALFFRTSGKEHTEWLIQHYSMHHLSANFAIILIACAGWTFFVGAYAISGASILCAYLLTTFALDNYLYAYQVTFRNAYLALHNLPTSFATPNAEAGGESVIAGSLSPDPRLSAAEIEDRAVNRPPGSVPT